MSIFSDLTSEFQLIDYSPSHNQLLIRSNRIKSREYNIDIIIKGVSFLLIPSSFKGIEISVFEIESNKYLMQQYSLMINSDYQVFSLKDSDGKIYLLNAMCLGVYQNKLDILESSIGRYDFENYGENLLWYSG